ncbi:hypothetical protein JCM11641_005960, partial [Rhodosporidiobolus odoratus]
SLDLTHLPGLHLTSDPSTGQAVQTSVPADDGLRGLSDKLAEADRKRRSQRSGSVGKGRDVERTEGRRRGEQLERVPVPAVPDLRFEQGVLASLRPFIHRLSPLPTASLPSPSPSSEAKTAATEKAVLVTTDLTAEGTRQAGGTGEGSGREEADVFDLMDGVRVQWAKVGWVVTRDQVIFPLLQGVLWCVGGYYLSAFLSWNRARVHARSLNLPKPSLLRSLGIRAGP